jgi:hypothetical protein
LYVERESYSLCHQYIVSHFRQVGVCAIADKELDHVWSASDRSFVQCSRASLANGVDFGAAGQHEEPNLVQISVLGSLLQRCETAALYRLVYVFWTIRLFVSLPSIAKRSVRVSVRRHQQIWRGFSPSNCPFLTVATISTCIVFYEESLCTNGKIEKQFKYFWSYVKNFLISVNIMTSAFFEKRSIFLTPF